MTSEDDLSKEIERERQQMEDAEYQRGWREGWSKAKNMDQIRIQQPRDVYNCGLEDGFNAAVRGESNRYPMVVPIIYYRTRNEAEQALGRIKDHPDYHDPDMWSIDDTDYGEDRGFVVNFNWDMDADTKMKWFRVAYDETTKGE